MSRRRPTEAEDPSLEDALPLPGAEDLANGKKRTPTEKAGRFFRTRPVTSLMLVVTICVISLITFAVGRTVGRAVGAMFRSSSATAAVSVVRADNSEARRVATLHFNHTDPHKHELHEAAEDDDDDDDREDEKGALIDGAAKLDGPPPAEGKRAEENLLSDSDRKRTSTCHRKYEPGKFGWSKTLCITDEFFFDMSIASEKIGTMKIGVFGEVVPKSAANFRALVTCTGAFSDESLCFKGDSFHRVVTNFVAQGGSKATGRSIYGPTFREEQSKDHHSFLEHAEKGVVSWAEYPIGSQFFILVRREAKYLDGNHVVFGVVTEGLDVLDKIHEAPRQGEEPLSRISIDNCGDAHAKI